ncbi:hypothetical protein ACHAXT_003046 [Thalassiosira profunda]
MAGAFLHSCRRSRLLLPPLASLLLSAESAAFRPPSVTMARRSARLQKRPLAASAGDPSTSTSDQYGSMKVEELRDLLRKRGLAVSGVKSMLVERLAASYDESLNAEGAPNTSHVTPAQKEGTQPKAKRARKKSTPNTSPKAASSSSGVDCLPRTREVQLQSSQDGGNLAIIGVDEAGRGPLAGPVVAAAAIVPTDIAGIIDSKKITSEDERERLYEELVATPDIRYAVAIVSAQRIDEINILQATLEGMRMAVEAVMGVNQGKKGKKNNVASAERTDLSYVVTGGSVPISSGAKKSNNNYYALIDGNKTPKDMPCPCESMTKGDGREYSIGAASILAKVTRDRLMHEYNLMYPEYNLTQHKGYPTAAHMSVVKELGASPIHRRTFAPLKHMTFDAQGRIIG